MERGDRESKKMEGGCWSFGMGVEVFLGPEMGVEVFFGARDGSGGFFWGQRWD